jgi:exosortase A
MTTTQTFESDSIQTLASPQTQWRRALIALFVGFIAITVLFWPTVSEMVRVWEESAAYGHCWLIPIVSAYLVWDRRDDVRKLQPYGYWQGAIIVLLSAIIWVIGWASSVNFVMQFAYVGMLQGLVLATLGPIVTRGLFFPLAFLLFVVPFGEEFVPILQSITVWFCISLLKLFNIPFFHDGVFISLAVKDFEVAEECSGIRYMTAMAATAVLFAHIGFQSWIRRIILLVVAFIVPIVANGVRAFGIIYIAYVTDGEHGVGIDHILYGWVFFGIVMALVIFIGHFFMDKPISAPAMDVSPLLEMQAAHLGTKRLPEWIGTGVAVGAATLAVLYSTWALSGSAPQLTGRMPPPVVAEWRPVEAPQTENWKPTYKGASRILRQTYTNDSGRLVTLYIAAFAEQSGANEMIRHGHGIHGGDTGWTFAMALAPVNVGQNIQPSVMQINGYGSIRDAFQWYYVNGKLFSSANRAKIEVGLAKLLGRPSSVATVAVSEERSEMKSAAQDLEKFVVSLGSIEAIAKSSLMPKSSGGKL